MSPADQAEHRATASWTGSASRVDRRAFLQAGLWTGALALSGGAARGARATSPAAATAADAATALPARRFGRTGRDMPVLGHGGSAFSERFMPKYRLPEGSELPSFEQRVEMVRHAYDLGVRYFDTARVYGESERIMGAALRDRPDAFVATKLAVFDPAAARQSVEQSLQELGRSSVDCMQIHSPTIERLGYDGAMKVHEQLVKLRDEGLFRWIGLTTHVAFESVYKLVATGGFDQVLLARGYFPIGLDTVVSHQSQEWRELCVAKAHELGMGIVIMKVMGAAVFGHSSRTLVADFDEERRRLLPAAAIRWVLQDPRVHVLNVGMTFPEDVARNREIVLARQTLSDEERALLADFSRRAYDSEFVQSLQIA